MPQAPSRSEERGAISIAAGVMLAAGLALGIVAQLMLAQREAAVAILRNRGGALWTIVTQLTWIHFAEGVGIALGLLLVGGALFAMAVGVPQAELRSRASIAADPGWDRRAAAMLTAAALCGVLTLLSCLQSEPSNWTVVPWILSLLLPVPALVVRDRRRGTSLGNPFSSRAELASVAAISVACLLLVAHDLDHWRWSGTPDETSFFDVARSIVDGESRRFWLSDLGVSELHSVLSSVYQAAFMAVFGADVFGFRMSSAFAFAVALPFLYLLARELLGLRVALLAVLLFGSTPLVVTFAHLGYDNVQVFPIVCGSLALFVWGWRRASLLGLYAAGCVAGFGFYTYYPARLAPLLLLLLRGCLGRVGAMRPWPMAIVLGGILLAVVPVLARGGEVLENMSSFTSLTGGGRTSLASLIADPSQLATVDGRQLLTHAALALVYPIWFVRPHHFQSQPVVDPLTGFAFVAGVWLCLAAMRRGVGPRFLLLAWLLATLLVGATSQHDRPPLTRLLFIAPFVALLAAVALDRLLHFAGVTPARLGKLGWALVTFSIVWSIATLQYNLRVRYHGYGNGTTAELVRLTRELPPDRAIVYLQLDDGTDRLARWLSDHYRMEDRMTYLFGFDERARETLATIEPPFTVVIGGHGEQREAAGEILSARFPDTAWQHSDPGRSWNLRHFSRPH